METIQDKEESGGETAEQSLERLMARRKRRKARATTCKTGSAAPCVCEVRSAANSPTMPTKAMYT